MSKKSENQNQAQEPQVDRRRMDVGQAAQRLRLSRRTVYRLIHEGELKAATFGRVRGLQVWESSIEEYEARKAREAEAATY